RVSRLRGASSGAEANAVKERRDACHSRSTTARRGTSTSRAPQVGRLEENASAKLVRFASSRTAWCSRYSRSLLREDRHRGLKLVDRLVTRAVLAGHFGEDVGDAAEGIAH